MDAGYANLQSKVGFIYGSFAIASIVFVYICVPECQGRSFEEIDQLFRMKIPLRKFHKHELPDELTEIDVNGISKA